MEQTQTGPSNVIVAGTDLRSAGAEALREALRIVQQLRGTALHVVYAVPHEEGSGAWAIARLSGRHERARGMLARHVATVCKDTAEHAALEEIVLHVRVGNPAAAIHQVAIDHEADFIVVGTRKRNSMIRWLEGSVSRELANIAHCPVVIAHPKDYRGLRRSDSVLPPRPGQQNDPPSEQGEHRMPERRSRIAGLL